MNIHAVIYTKPNCPKCRMTENKLRESMRVKTEHLFEGNEEWSQRKLEKFREQGYASMPVVRIYYDDTGKRLDDWCDMRIDLIHKWKGVAENE